MNLTEKTNGNPSNILIATCDKLDVAGQAVKEGICNFIIIKDVQYNYFKVLSTVLESETIKLRLEKELNLKHMQFKLFVKFVEERIIELQTNLTECRQSKDELEKIHRALSGETKRCSPSQGDRSS